MAQGRGYIAIERELFNHPLFRNNPRWLVAWQMLIAQAAWKPDGKRFGAGIIHVERGQTALTLRQFAKQLRMSHSSVVYILKCLEDDGMIEKKILRTSRRTRIGIKESLRVTVITICNYNKFQTALRGQRKRADQAFDQAFDQGDTQAPALPGLIAPLPIQPINHIESKGQPREVSRPPPKHGTPSPKHKTVYLYKGTEDWRIHAADYRNVMGAEPLPDRHGAFWFYVLGEKLRPAHQRFWHQQQRRKG